MYEAPLTTILQIGHIEVNNMETRLNMEIQLLRSNKLDLFNMTFNIVNCLPSEIATFTLSKMTTLLIAIFKLSNITTL